MRRLLLMIAACILSTVAVGFVVAIVTVRLYWGHWFAPPDADRTAATAVSIERFSSFAWDGTATSGRDALADAARWENNGLGESPTGRLPAALLRGGLRPAADDAVPPETLTAIRDLLIAEGHSVEEMRADVAEGKGTDGRLVVLAAVFGPEVSNDHRPYYEVAAVVGDDGRLQPIRVIHYQYDVAGLEGSAHLMTAIPAAIVCLFVWGAIFLIQIAGGFRRCG
jgi:hypothetical protein